jgi:hypothetical protein
LAGGNRVLPGKAEPWRGEGPRATADILLGGLVLGTAFCLLRRLWPLAVAHFLANVF